jgi:uncharacterized membrane protein YkoI
MKPRMIADVLRAWIAVTLLVTSHAASASDDEHEWEDDDHAYDRARRAVERGEALPIAQLLERLQARVPGELVGVDFTREHGRWVYEFRVVDDGGYLLEIEMDAQTGRILSMEED